jgi:hypothetical protein
MRTSARSFRELGRLCGGAMYDPASGAGLFPYNAACLRLGKFTAAFLGQAREHVQQLYEEASALLLSE